MEKNYYNETTNTAAGIPTPPDKENVGPFDSLNEWVEAGMDTIAHDLVGEEHTARHAEQAEHAVQAEQTGQVRQGEQVRRAGQAERQRRDE